MVLKYVNHIASLTCKIKNKEGDMLKVQIFTIMQSIYGLAYNEY